MVYSKKIINDNISLLSCLYSVQDYLLCCSQVVRNPYNMTKAYNDAAMCNNFAGNLMDIESMFSQTKCGEEQRNVRLQCLWNSSSVTGRPPFFVFLAFSTCGRYTEYNIMS